MATVAGTIESLGGDTTLPNGLPALVLSLCPADLSERAPLDWDEGVDELDRYQSAAVRVTPEAPTFVLLAYERDPLRTTSVIAEPRDAVRDDLAALLHALRIAPGEVVDRASWAGGVPLDAATLAETWEFEHTATELADQLSDLQASAAQLQRRVALILAENHALGLTHRQREVLALSGRGKTWSEIADELDVSQATVKRHLRRAMNELGAGKVPQSSRPSGRR